MTKKIKNSDSNIDKKLKYGSPEKEVYGSITPDTEEKSFFRRLGRFCDLMDDTVSGITGETKMSERKIDVSLDTLEKESNILIRMYKKLFK